MNVACFALFCGISIFLVSIPSPWHWRSRNTGTLIYIAWSLIANIVYFVNAVIWRNNADNVSPVWCDICECHLADIPVYYIDYLFDITAIKLQVALGPGLSGASLCITRRLAKIATSKTSVTDSRQRRNDMIIDLGIGVGVPVMIMIMSIVVQPHRFNIIEGFGCSMPTWRSLPAIFIIPLWPIVFGFVSSLYGGKNRGISARSRCTQHFRLTVCLSQPWL
jgi:pheromone a factor receptor